MYLIYAGKFRHPEGGHHDLIAVVLDGADDPMGEAEEIAERALEAESAIMEWSHVAHVKPDGTGGIVSHFRRGHGRIIRRRL